MRIAYLLMLSSLTAQPTTRPATTRPAATRPAVHVLTAEEKARILQLNRETIEVNRQIRTAATKKDSQQAKQLRERLAFINLELVAIRRGSWTPPTTQPEAEEREIKTGMTFQQVQGFANSKGYEVGSNSIVDGFETKTYRFPLREERRSVLCTFRHGKLVRYVYEPWPEQAGRVGFEDAGFLTR